MEPGLISMRDVRTEGARYVGVGAGLSKTAAGTVAGAGSQKGVGLTTTTVGASASGGVVSSCTAGIAGRG